MPDTEERNLGAQPMDDLLTEHGLVNHDVVAADGTLAVTHKVVGKARKGRRLTARMQKKVLQAVNGALGQRGLPPTTFAGLFNYVGP